MRKRKMAMDEQPIVVPQRGEVIYKPNAKLTKKRQKTFAFDKKLIEAARTREVIYNPANKSNRYVEQKEKAWIQIASELKVPVKKCKARWTSLRDRYRRITKEQEQTVQRGLRFYNRWRYYESLNFLSENSLLNPISSPAENQIQSHGVFTIIPYSAIDHVETRKRCSPPTKVERLEECDSIEEVSTPTCGQESANNVCVENNATSMFFMSLAKRIQSANLPPLIQMKLESDILNFTINQIEEILKN